MYTSFYWIYILPLMIISPFMTISMNSWFSIWMSLELNLMSFIPLIIITNKYYKELALKYFIIQSFSSSMLILSSNMMLMNFNLNSMNLNMINLYLLNFALLIKIGACPFHSWFINMMNNLSWMNCFILSTWQKIAPMILLMLNYNNNLLYFSIIYSALIGAIFGLNHQSIRTMMSYSSINHISWMLLNLMISEYMWIMYFYSYFLMNLSIMMILNNFNIFFLTQINLIKTLNNKFILLMNLLSISGLPPMFGFMMKWFSIFLICKTMNIFIMIILTLLSLLTFTFYTRLSICLFMNFNKNIKINLYNNNFYYYKISFKMNFLMIFLNLWIINNWIM